MDILAPPTAARPRRPRFTLWSLRFLLTAHLLVVLAQPVLAGRYLVGDVDAMRVHGIVGSALALVAMALVAAALAHVVAARSRLWLPVVVVLLFLVEGFQIGSGHDRRLEVHVPVGVAIVVVAVLLAAWVWTPSAAEPRRTR